VRVEKSLKNMSLSFFVTKKSPQEKNYTDICREENIKSEKNGHRLSHPVSAHRILQQLISHFGAFLRIYGESRIRNNKDTLV